MENEISLLERLASIEPAHWCASIAAIAVFVVEAILVARKRILAGPDKKLGYAKAAGHVITATLEHCSTASVEDNYNYIARYVYTVGNKVKRKVLHTNSYPSKTIPLYYISNPNKAFVEGELEGRPLHILLTLMLYVIPILAYILVAKALGVDFSAYVE